MADPVGKPCESWYACLSGTLGVRSVNRLHSGEHHEAVSGLVDVVQFEGQRSGY